METITEYYQRRTCELMEEKYALLAALKAVCEWALKEGDEDWMDPMEESEMDQFPCFKAARDAISKAEGKGES
jgi:hypothetical protein